MSLIPILFIFLITANILYAEEKNPDKYIFKDILLEQLLKKDVNMYILIDASSLIEYVKELIYEELNAIKELIPTERILRIAFGTMEKTQHYIFYHKLNFTENIGQYKKVVDSMSFYNGPELESKILHGIMQVAVCNNIIEFKTDANKIILAISNWRLNMSISDSLESEKPFDKECHLDVEGYYKKPPHMQNPTLEEISRKLYGRNVSIIFAVTSKVQEDYEDVKNVNDKNDMTSILVKLLPHPNPYGKTKMHIEL